MSEPTSAQEEAAADAGLDAQIDEWYAERHQPVNRSDFGEHPDPKPPESYWYDDRDEVAAFARWYFDTGNYIGFRAEILDFIEKPWKWDEEYAGYKAENP